MFDHKVNTILLPISTVYFILSLKICLNFTFEQVTLDGHDLKSLNTKWLRNNIGVVSQEPVLFDMSIEDNIKFGAIHEPNELEVIEAAKMANAHDFIVKLPNVSLYILEFLKVYFYFK